MILEKIKKTLKRIKKKLTKTKHKLKRTHKEWGKIKKKLRWTIILNKKSRKIRVRFKK